MVAKRIGLVIGWVCVGFIPLRLKAQERQVYKIAHVTIVPQAAMESLPTKFDSYARWIRWLIPATKSSCIYNYLALQPGTFCYVQDFLGVKKKLLALPYFAAVSVTAHKSKLAAKQVPTVDLVIRTQDRFPLTVGVNLAEGPLLTLIHQNLGGYGYQLENHFFLKKRWGYGCTCLWPIWHGSYLLGAALYRHMGAESSYAFDYKDIWGGKLFPMSTASYAMPFYWFLTGSVYDKQFTKRSPVVSKTIYPDHKLILGKVGWVVDGYKSMRNVYSLGVSESLPNGGVVTLCGGYQVGERHDRPYLALSCIQNIACKTAYFYVHGEAGTFCHKAKFEEIIAKLTLEGIVLPLHIAGNTWRPFMHVDYITGSSMPQGRRLGMVSRDPEDLALPEGVITQPIQHRLNVHMGSLLHKPILMHVLQRPIRFVFTGFIEFIALYDQNYRLLNATLVDNCGIGIRLAHAVMHLPPLEFRVGYSPLSHRVVASFYFAICPFKVQHKPTLIPYS